MPVTVEMVLSTLKRIRQVCPSKCFIIDHFRNNDENDQYHDVLVDETVHCSHHINVIISAGPNEILVCCHPTVFINWGWLIGEKFVLPDCPMYFAVGAMFF